MKALTLSEPWATLMKLGEKNVETRSWSVSYRGPMIIHASKKYPLEGRRLASTNPYFMKALGDVAADDTLGCGLCIRNLTAVVSTDDSGILGAALAERGVIGLGHKEIAFGDYSPGRFAWFFDKEIWIFTPPILPAPRSFHRGLWNWKGM